MEQMVVQGMERKSFPAWSVLHEILTTLRVWLLSGAEGQQNVFAKRREKSASAETSTTPEQLPSEKTRGKEAQGLPGWAMYRHPAS